MPWDQVSGAGVILPLALPPQLLEYLGKGKSIVDVGLAQARHPLSTRSHYFEVGSKGGSRGGRAGPHSHLPPEPKTLSLPRERSGQQRSNQAARHQWPCWGPLGSGTPSLSTCWTRPPRGPWVQRGPLEGPNGDKEGTEGRWQLQMSEEQRRAQKPTCLDGTTRMPQGCSTWLWTELGRGAAKGSRGTQNHRLYSFT